MSINIEAYNDGLRAAEYLKLREYDKANKLASRYTRGTEDHEMFLNGLYELPEGGLT